MATTVQAEKMRFCLDYYLQDGNQHEVVVAKTLMRVMLNRYAKHHDGRLPKKIIVYRDGASDTDFKTVSGGFLRLSFGVVDG